MKCGNWRGRPGYLMDDSVRIVQVNPDENASFVFTNTRKPSLVIVKYDPNTGKYLAGATFRDRKGGRWALTIWTG